MLQTCIATRAARLALRPVREGDEETLLPLFADWDVIRWLSAALSARWRSSGVALGSTPSIDLIRSGTGEPDAQIPVLSFTSARLRQAFSETKVFSSLCLTAPKNVSWRIRMTY